MKMPPSNSENYAGNGEDEVAKLLKQLTQLWIDEGEDAGFEGTCKHLGLKVIQKSDNSDDEEESDEERDSDTEEVLHAGRHADPDSEDDGIECCIKSPPPHAVQIILDGYKRSQEEIVNSLKAQCDKLGDPANKLKFLTRLEPLVQGYSVTPITYTAFTNKSRILLFLLDELCHNCGISLRHLSEHLDQRDRDGNNLLMAMAASQLDLSDSFKVLFNFQHYPHDGKKYFLVNHGLINHRGETIFMILERNGDITSEIKERIRKTLQELIESPEFEKEWIGDVLTSTKHQLPVEEDSENNQDRFVQIVQDVSDPHANLTIRQDSQPKAAPNPEQRLDPAPAVNLHEENNPAEEGVEDIPIPIPEPVPQAIPVPGPANVAEDIPAPGPNFHWVCANEACGAVYQTMEEALQCAQVHGADDVLPFDELALQDGGDMEGFLLI